MCDRVMGLGKFILRRVATQFVCGRDSDIRCGFWALFPIFSKLRQVRYYGGYSDSVAAIIDNGVKDALCFFD